MLEKQREGFIILNQSGYIYMYFKVISPTVCLFWMNCNTVNLVNYKCASFCRDQLICGTINSEFRCALW